MSTPFADPASSAGINFEDLSGSLLMLEVLGYEEHIPTVYTEPGEKNPAVRANLTVVDGRLAGTTYEDAFIFPKVLIGQLRSRVGQLVLGRLGKGEAKRGQSAPWKLEPATTPDRRAAEEFMSRAARGAARTASSAGEPPF